MEKTVKFTISSDINIDGRTFDKIMVDVMDSIGKKIEYPDNRTFNVESSIDNDYSFFRSKNIKSYSLVIKDTTSIKYKI